MTEPYEQLTEKFDTSRQNTKASLNQPVRTLTDDSFTMYHLGIGKGNWEHRFKERAKLDLKKANSKNGDCFQVARIYYPHGQQFIEALAKVGSPYGWDRAKNIQDLTKVEDSMKESGTEFYEFRLNDENVGFCVIKSIQPYGACLQKAKAHMKPFRTLKAKELTQ